MAAGHSLVVGNSGGYTNKVAVQVSNGYDSSAATLGNTDWAGASWAHDHAYAFNLPWNMYWPQFYALAYIMKVVAL